MNKTRCIRQYEILKERAEMTEYILIFKKVDSFSGTKKVEMRISSTYTSDIRQMFKKIEEELKE
jgi:hypothetical protein